MTIWVDKVYGIIVAISEHIKSGKSLACACIAIRVDKPANFGVIITALEIIETRFSVVVVTAVAQRINFSHAAGCRNDLAIGVIIVSSDFVAGRID